MAISASKRVVLIDYFLRKNLYNIMLWAAFIHVLKTEITTYYTPIRASDRAAAIALIEKLVADLFKKMLQSNWDAYVQNTKTEDELGGTFFEREMFGKIIKIVNPTYEPNVLETWKKEKWPKRVGFSGQFKNLTHYSEHTALLEVRKKRLSPWAIHGLYKNIWNEVLNFYPNDISTKLIRILSNHITRSSDFGFKFIFSVGFCLYLILFSIEGTALRKKIDQNILYVGGASGAAGAVLLFAATLLLLNMLLPFIKKIEFNAISRSLTSSKGTEISDTDFLPELFFMGLIEKIVDELTPPQKIKKPKQQAQTRGEANSRVAAPLVLAVAAPVPAFEPVLEEKSLLMQAGFGRIFESTQFALGKRVDEPVVRDTVFYCYDSDGVQRTVYPFKNIFVADILSDQTDDAAIKARITSVLKDGHPLEKGQKGKTGFKLYSTGSEAPKPRGAADGVLKIDRKMRVICAAHRVDVTGDDVHKNAIVYFPQIIASKTSFKFSRPS